METSALTPAAWLELEAIVSRFEGALHEQRRPKIRDYLCVATQVDAVTLLLELIAAEAEQRGRRGEPVTCSEYATAFADLLSTIADQQRLAVVLAEACETISHSPPAERTSAGRAAQRRIAPSKPRWHYQLIEPLSSNSQTGDSTDAPLR